MKENVKKLSGLLCGAALAFTSCLPVLAESSPQAALDMVKEGQIAILHTNDVHCGGLIAAQNSSGIYSSVGYGGVEAAKEAIENVLGEANTTLVDAGDAIQGQPIGTLSKGEDIISIMNQMEYDLAVPGNHEFDYGVDQLLKLADEADFEYLSCNIENLETEKALFKGYDVIEYQSGDETVRVAYVGITTPVTLTSTSPAVFENAQGETIYSFYGGNNGQDLYDQVQKTVDEARDVNGGDADYVIAIAHLGSPASSSLPEMYTSKAVVENTSGIDGVIDGHTHLIYNEEFTNKNGEKISVSQAGMQLQAYGLLTITPDGDPDPSDVTSNLIIASEQEEIEQAESSVQFIQSIQEKLNEKLDIVIGKNEVPLSFLSPDEEGKPWWYTARMHETNLGDFVADAYRAIGNTPIGLVNGGGVRWKAAVEAIEPQDLTYGNMIDINPYANSLSVASVKGQTLLDALEYSVRSLTPAFDDSTEAEGGFLQVSGLSFTARVDIPSPVLTNEDGSYLGVDGQRRVSNVYVGMQALDPEQEYLVTTITYLLEGGSGYSMLADEAEILYREVALDYDALTQYLQDDLRGVIGDRYENAMGEGRISLLVAEPENFSDVVPGSWYAAAVDYLSDRGIMNGYGNGRFGINDGMSRAQLITALWRYENPSDYESYVPEQAKNETSFEDVGDGMYWTGAINWAYKNRIVTGYTSELFGPNDPVSFEQLITILYRNYGDRTGEVMMEILDDFADADEISAYALEAMAWGLEYDLIHGSNGSLRPLESCTRQRVAVVLYNGIINDILTN